MVIALRHMQLKMEDSISRSNRSETFNLKSKQLQTIISQELMEMEQTNIVVNLEKFITNP